MFSKIASYAVLTIGAITMVAPFLWMITTSLKAPGTLTAFASFDKRWWEEWIPTSFEWKNYVRVWQVVPFAKFYINSIFVAACTTFAQVATSAMAAYAFARLRFPGRDKIFFSYLATMMVPGAVTMIPVFILLRYLGWIDSYKGVILPAAFTSQGSHPRPTFQRSIRCSRISRKAPAVILHVLTPALTPS